jgi:hypothetical protein
MSRARDIEWPIAIQQSDGYFHAALHCSSHVFREHHVRDGVGIIPVILRSQRGKSA